jgi:hypothetical protein
MAARRLVIVMLVLLFVSTLAAALVPAPESEDAETTRTTQTPAEEPAGREVVARLDAADERAPAIRMKAGDRLALTVRSPRPDQVEIRGLGQLEDVDPASPARFDLIPTAAGSYPIRLLGAGREVGRIAVSESRRRSGRSAGTSR